MAGGRRWREGSVRVAVVLGGFLLVPLIVLVRERPAEFVELIFVVHHLGAGVAGHRVLVLEEDRFLRADFLAEPAVNAAEHVDIEGLRGFFDVHAVGLVSGDFAGRDPDGFGRADEFAELAGNTFFAAVRVAHKCRHAAVAGRNSGALFGILERLLRRDEMLKGRSQPTHDLRKVGALEERERLAFYSDDGHGAVRGRLLLKDGDRDRVEEKVGN